MRKTQIPISVYMTKIRVKKGVPQGSYRVFKIRDIWFFSGVRTGYS